MGAHTVSAQQPRESSLGIFIHLHVAQFTNCTWIEVYHCNLMMQVTKLHHDLEEAIHTNTQLLADSSARQVELRSKEDELAGLRVEILKVIKVSRVHEVHSHKPKHTYWCCQLLI